MTQTELVATLGNAPGQWLVIHRPDGDFGMVDATTEHACILLEQLSQERIVGIYRHTECGICARDLQARTPTEPSSPWK